MEATEAQTDKKNPHKQEALDERKETIEKEGCVKESNRRREQRGPRREAPVGILRLDGSVKPKRSVADLRILIQAEPPSPQPSVDRLSVTFAEDSVRSDSSTRCNLFIQNASSQNMDKVHFPTATDVEESDEEDYSASVNAIIQRKVSLRRSRRRSKRRPSSPFSPDILPGTEGGRRRSSVFTTSSGDTAISIEENPALDLTQQQIFENIKLHKEVLSNVKMQPWPMRKKLKLVMQAKSYVKRHEGALQERFTQSYSLKNMLTRWNIYLVKKWHHYKRELTNFSNLMIPWESRIKEIESHFGSVVASYFIFLRWLFWVNVVIAAILLAFVAVPERTIAPVYLQTLIADIIGNLCQLFSLFMHRLPEQTLLKMHYAACILTTMALVHCVQSLTLKEALEKKSVEDEVTFHLFHYLNLEQGQDLFIDNSTALIKSRFNRNLATKFIIHGWLHGVNAHWVKEMREVMANRKKWNVILVSWSPMSNSFYSQARDHSRIVGEQLGKMCGFLQKNRYVTLPTLHFIGHSMGAHIAGYAAEYLRSEFGQLIGKITGLDPVTFLFESPSLVNPSERLDQNDARFVDVIHTNGRGLGMMTPIGDVDFYPNGGIQQPGCGSWMCSHERSCELWIASVKNPCEYQAISYESWGGYLAGDFHKIVKVLMGINARVSIPKGLYFLETSHQPPYVDTEMQRLGFIK